jgi:hypothetical protein
MITYKIDKPSHAKVNSQIRDMENVLAEIPTSLQVLLELVQEQEATISSPSIAYFRSELERSVAEAIEHTRRIATDSQKLVSVSEQAAKHLSAIEEHFGAVLRSKSTSPVNDQVRI